MSIDDEMEQFKNHWRAEQERRDRKLREVLWFLESVRESESIQQSLNDLRFNDEDRRIAHQLGIKV